MPSNYDECGWLGRRVGYQNKNISNLRWRSPDERTTRCVVVATGTGVVSESTRPGMSKMMITRGRSVFSLGASYLLPFLPSAQPGPAKAFEGPRGPECKSCCDDDGLRQRRSVRCIGYATWEAAESSKQALPPLQGQHMLCIEFVSSPTPRRMQMQTATAAGLKKGVKASSEMT